MERVLTGIKPTGKIHLGNYFGSIRDIVYSQSDYEVFLFIADLHALTSKDVQKSPKEFSNNIKDLTLNLIALGVDPKKTKFYIQSNHKQITILKWIFDCLISLPSLERAHAFKDAAAKKSEINAGLLTYPVLMSADILIADADLVPVGPDQKQHIEIARDIARLFNNTYGKFFKEPKEKVVVDSLTGTDGRKMSKSYKNTIEIFTSEEEFKKQIMKIVTDSKSEKEVKDPNKCPVFKLHSLFNWDDLSEIESKYKSGFIGYKESKELLAERAWKFFEEARLKKAEMLKNENIYEEILSINKDEINTHFDSRLNQIISLVGLK